MADGPLRIEEVKGLRVLEMAHGVNAMDEELLLALREAVAEARDSGAPPLLLVSAHPRIFSPGWNLKRLAGAGREDVARFLALFEGSILDLFSYPGPTAVALDGHAIAGGCLLALACDRRVVSAGRIRIGLSEVNLGVPVPGGCLEMLRARLDPGSLEQLVLQGDGFTPQGAHEIGVVHRVVGGGSARPAAEADLRSLQAKSAVAYAATKRLLHGPAWSAARRAAEEEAGRFLDCWFSEDTRGRITAVAGRLGD